MLLTKKPRLIGAFFMVYNSYRTSTAGSHLLQRRTANSRYNQQGNYSSRCRGLLYHTRHPPSSHRSTSLPSGPYRLSLPTLRIGNRVTAYNNCTICRASTH